MLTPSSTQPTLRVAIYRTSSIGDVVLATACLDLLAQLAVPTEVTWVGRGAPLELLQSAWPELKIIEVKRDDTGPQLQRAVEQLANLHLFIDLQTNLRSRWLARQLKSQHKIPVFAAQKAQLRRSRLIVEARVRGRRKPLPERVRTAPRLQYDMMCDALRKGLRHHLPVERRDGLESKAPRPRLNVPEAFERPWRKELKYGAWLAIAPGAAHATKQAPLELVVEILARVRAVLADKSGAPPQLGLAFFGDSNDRQVARQLLDQLNWSGPVLNLTGRLSLFESAVALKEVSCLLSNDSSLAHIAEAVETPTTVLFGPTVEAFGFSPRMKKSRAFSSPTGCRPCSKHGKIPCRYEDKLCFGAISLEDVAQHLVGLLVSPEARHARRGPHQPSLETGDSTLC